MLPLNWKPVLVEDLVIVGPEEDGGYFATGASLEPVQSLISMGLHDDWRFEADFLRRTGAKVLCYDHSVTARFWIMYTIRALLRRRFHQLGRAFAYRKFFSGDRARHVQLMIGPDGPGAISLNTILKSLPSGEQLFLKMDIEGGEYAILEQIIAARSQFTGMVMELHDIADHRETIDRFFEALPEFTIVAMHPNNFYGPDANGDPRLLEVSLMRNDFVQPNPASTAPRKPPTIAANQQIELTFG